MKLGLVNAGLPAKVSSCLRTCAYPPLSIVYLASFLRRQLPRLELVLVDDQLGDDLRFNDLDCCDLIGISANSITYPRAIEIAESIKCTAPAALIVLGGIHGTVMWRQVLTNKPCFDYVVLGQGEVALLGLLVGTPVSAIPNLSYREGDESRRNPFQFVPIESIPPPDFTLLEHSSYSRNFRKHYGNKSGLRSAAFTSSTGCAWREASGGCAFCSIPPIRHSRLSPCRFWTHVQVVQTAAHADFLWDVSDTFTSDATWVGQVGEAKPSATDVSFHVYARANDLADARLLGALRRIGVVEALVGAESFDDRILKTCNKGVTSAQIFRALRALQDAGIRVALSLVFGLPGEDVQSLNNTIAACERIRQEFAIAEMHASIITPLPGSPLFSSLLRNPQMRKLYEHIDVIPHEALLGDYVRLFTNCCVEDLVEAYVTVDNMFPSAGPFYLREDSPVYQRIGYRGMI